jgi:hypothetical protein
MIERGAIAYCRRRRTISIMQTKYKAVGAAQAPPCARGPCARGGDDSSTRKEDVTRRRLIKDELRFIESPEGDELRFIESPERNKTPRILGAGSCCPQPPRQWPVGTIVSHHRTADAMSRVSLLADVTAPAALPLPAVAPSAALAAPAPAFAKAPRRWAVLLAFSLSSALNAFLWIQFAPIANIVSQRFEVSLSAVNWLSLCFMLLFVPGAAVSIFVTERFGMRALLLGAAAANLVAALVRYLGAYAPPAGQFAVVTLGQCIAALAQPAFINAPSRISGDWFSEHDRATATTIAAMSNVVGLSLIHI